jgi:hypothetical protein
VGIGAIALVSLAMAIVPWWSSGGGSMFGMSLDLTGIKVCLGNLCERQWYSELPRQAFAKHAAPFVTLGRVTLGLAIAASLALAVHLAVRRATSIKVAPARLALILFAVALAASAVFFVLRPDISWIDPQGAQAPEPTAELGDAMIGMLVPKLSIGLGFPLFVLGSAAGIAASILALRQTKA